MWLDDEMFIFERKIAKRAYRIAAETIWDPVRQRPFGRQAVLGAAAPAPKVDLAKTRTTGARKIGDVGALAWVAEQLGVVKLIDEACGPTGSVRTASVGEMALAVALQRACAPSAKCDLPEVLQGFLPKHCCLPPSAFTGQAYHRIAAGVDDEMLEKAQLALARKAVECFHLTANVLAFDTTNFDTFIATATRGELAERGHAKSKRGDLRVVGLAVLASETGHVPLLYRTYPGNGSDQEVLTDCLGGLAQLHRELGEAEGRPGAERTIVRDGGSWGEQLELDLDVAGYFTLISLPLGHNAAKDALAHAAVRGRMKPLAGKLAGVRAYRLVADVGELRRTLVVVESEELLRGQKHGIAVALRKANKELRKLARGLERQRAAQTGRGRWSNESVQARVQRILAREHLSQFVTTRVRGTDAYPTLKWTVDARKRRALERTRLGKRVLCTDRHSWSTKRIVTAFRGQWKIEELFRRTKKQGVSPWGPSYQRCDASLRLHTFATVLGLTLVSLAQLALGFEGSPACMMEELAALQATLVRETTGAPGRRPTHMIPPELTSIQRRAVGIFELDRWLPSLPSSTKEA
jgi:hypothetical protein